MKYTVKDVLMKLLLLGAYRSGSKTRKLHPETRGTLFACSYLW